MPCVENSISGTFGFAASLWESFRVCLNSSFICSQGLSILGTYVHLKIFYWPPFLKMMLQLTMFDFFCDLSHCKVHASIWFSFCRVPYSQIYCCSQATPCPLVYPAYVAKQLQPFMHHLISSSGSYNVQQLSNATMHDRDFNSISWLGY